MTANPGAEKADSADCSNNSSLECTESLNASKENQPARRDNIAWMQEQARVVDAVFKDISGLKSFQMVSFLSL